MKKSIHHVKTFLETLDNIRDRALFLVIIPYWPRKITPNHLTIARIAIGIFLFFLLFYLKNNSQALVVSLFFVGAITDLFDGSVARAFNKATNLGAMMDAIADRILIIPIAIYSLFNPHRWLFLFIILLEVTNTLIAAYAQGKNIFVESNIFGKIKMVLQSVVFGAILIFWPESPNMFFIYILWVSVVFLVASIVFKLLDIRSAIYGHS